MNQLSLFPFGSVETVLTHLQQLERQVFRLDQMLTDGQCIRLLSELALIGVFLDSVEGVSLERPPSARWAIRAPLPYIPTPHWVHKPSA